MSRASLAYIVLALSIAFALSPFVATDFAGYDPDDFPVRQDDPVILPAGWAFSIWGLIYVWLIAGAAYGAWKAAEDNEWSSMRVPLAIGLAIGVFWLSVASRSPPAATILIVIMAVSAILALLRAGETNPLLQRGPVGLYAGWLTAATGVSFGINLPGYGLMDAQLAAVLCLGGVLVVASWVQTARPYAWTYAFAVVWALFGIFVKGLSSEEPDWLILAIVATGILIIGARAMRPVLANR